MPGLSPATSAAVLNGPRGVHPGNAERSFDKSKGTTTPSPRKGQQTKKAPDGINPPGAEVEYLEREPQSELNQTWQIVL